MVVADVEPLEGYFQAHAMLESTLEAKPISITRNEIYGMLSILMRHVPIIVSLSFFTFVLKRVLMGRRIISRKILLRLYWMNWRDHLLIMIRARRLSCYV